MVGVVQHAQQIVLSSAVHIAALIQASRSSGVDACAEGVDEIEAFPFESADVLAEEGQYERLLGLQDLQTAEGDPTEQCPDKPGNEERKTGHAAMVHLNPAEDYAQDGGDEESDAEHHDNHAVFLGIQYLFFHDNIPPCSDDIKMISRKYQGVKTVWKKKTASHLVRRQGC